MLWQPPLPDSYLALDDAELDRRIEARKAELGSDLVILGHHYQSDSVVKHADFLGDSFKLSQLAAERVAEVGAKHVVFCGVHFMAETADLLTDDDVTVLLPDMGAGCSMADMADYDQTVDCWDDLTALYRRSGENVRIIPVCYMNSSAAIKAFCGEHGGVVCTSSNCDKIFDWVLAGGETPLAPGERVQVLFIPDQHLGRNTAAAAGFTPDVGIEGAPPPDAPDMCVYDPRSAQPLGGADPQQLLRSTFVLWRGHCSVHKLFRPEHVDQARAQQPGITVIAHPECTYAVCQKSDMTGSTEGIIRAIESAEPGSHWAIATEVHLVNRLRDAAAERGVHVRILSECQCLCTTMIRINPAHLLHTLDLLANGKTPNAIRVHPDAQAPANLALQRMLDVTAAAGRTLLQPT